MNDGTTSATSEGLLAGKVVLVTGAGRGIGAAAARRFAAEGASVVLAARTESQLASTVADIRGSGGRAEYKITDLTDTASVENAVRFTVDTYGRLDAAMNNGGIGVPHVPIDETREEDFDRIVATNFKGVFFSIASEVRAMLATANGGSIVNVSSVGSFRGAAGLSAYAAIKRAVNSLTETAAIEYGPQGIRVNAVAPGTTMTEMMDKWAESNPSVLEEHRSMTPLRRPGTPNEIAEAALWLLSDKAAYVTGIVTRVDGGMMA